MATGTQVRGWEGQCRCVYSVAFSPDGRLLAAGGGDGKAYLWEVASGRVVRRLEGHAGDAVSKVVFAPDGRTLATAAHDRTVHLWDVATGAELRKWTNHDPWAWGLAYAPNGRAVVSAGNDGAVVLRAVTPVPRKPPGPALTAAELDAAWRDLAAAEPKTAFDAAIRLAAAPPGQVVPFLRARLRPARTTVDSYQLGRWVRELDHDSFRVREAAYGALAAAGEQAGPTVRAALAAGPSAEAAERLRDLAGRLAAERLSPDDLRAVRAVRVPEELGTPESRALLEDLAGGAPGVKLTREAASAVARMKQPPQGDD